MQFKKIQKGWYSVILNGEKIGDINNFKGFWSAKFNDGGFISCCTNTKREAGEKVVAAYKEQK